MANADVRRTLSLSWCGCRPSDFTEDLNPTTTNSSSSDILDPVSFGRLRNVALYSFRQHAEGSHNGSAAVLKTAGRKAMQVRVLSPPPFQFFAVSKTTGPRKAIQI